MSEKTILEMKGIEIQFPGVKALDKVDFSLRAGEIHALLGENGAGKSTLIKCLTGVHHKDAGTILLDGKEITPDVSLHGTRPLRVEDVSFSGEICEGDLRLNFYVDAFDGTMMMVEQGRVDASINALGTIEEYLEARPDSNLKIVYVQPGDPVCIPMRKSAESAALLEKINGIIADAKADGTLSALSIRFFGKDLTVAP